VTVKPKRNSSPGSGSPERRRTIKLYRCLGHGGLAGLTGYGRRWAVDTAYSTFKRVFGEHSLARSLENIARELTGKVALYNMLVNV
jgi:hypothetical protein